MLVQNDDEAFLVEEFNETKVDKSYKKLRKSNSDFLDIHYAYVCPLEDSDQEDKFVLMEEVDTYTVGELISESISL